MSGFGTMVRKEFREIVATWRAWVCVGAFALFGIVDPVLARFTPAIMASVVGDQFPIELPEPTYLESWAQWAGDLAQLLAIVLIAVAAAAVAGEVSSGTLIIPLTKPIGRTAFVLAKFVAIAGLAIVSAAIGTALATAVTYLMFDGVDAGPVWNATGVWLALAVLLIALTMLGSCLASSTMTAFMIGFAAYIAISLIGLWPPARAYSPAGLNEAIANVAAGQSAAFAWPAATALGLAILALCGAVLAFRRREL